MRDTGTVTTNFENRSFGFITSDTDGISRFFHYTNYPGKPELGARVEYELAAPTRLGKDKQCVKIALVAAQSGRVGA